MKRLRLAICCLWTLVCSLGAAAQDIRFAAPEYPPYTGEVDGEATGIGVTLVEDIMRRAGLRMSVHIVPNYSRCVFEVSHQHADGFFLGSRNAERDAVAVLSRPVMINRWIWVSMAKNPAIPDTDAPAGPIGVGVLLNTNPHIWLKDHGYRITGTPTSAVSLIAMLEAGRFDLALVPELVFQHAVQQTGRNPGNYATRLHSNQAFGIYVGKSYLRRYPDALDRINKAIAETASRTAPSKPSARKSAPS